MTNLGDYAQAFTLKLKQFLPKFEDWTNSTSLEPYLTDRDVLMLGLRSGLLPHKEIIEDARKIATTWAPLTESPGVREDEHETVIGQLKLYFGICGIDAFLSVNWDKLETSAPGYTARWRALAEFLTLLCVGLELAAQWGI